ncbi:MAG: pilus assembly protein [Candidatus Latescibacterota bacterium]|nr:MAG: pilus assembly protein [Candidatus Latescibacterota bacterium]
MDRKRKLVSYIRGNRGQSVIEFALVLPLLLLLLFGITEFGRAWMTMNILTSAAREGCRLAVVTAPNVPAVTARVTAVCGSAGITPTSINVTGPDASDPERRVTVTVQANFQIIPGTILGTFSGTIPLSATSVMRHESI